MSTPEWIKLITDALADSSRHFALAFLAGALAYCLISTILYACYWAVNSTRSKMSTAAAYSIICISGLALLAVCLLSHVALDFWQVWYTAPLGPPLIIDTGGVIY